MFGKYYATRHSIGELVTQAFERQHSTAWRDNLEALKSCQHRKEEWRELCKHSGHSGYSPAYYKATGEERESIEVIEISDDD